MNNNVSNTYDNLSELGDFIKPLREKKFLTMEEMLERDAHREYLRNNKIEQIIRYVNHISSNAFFCKINMEYDFHFLSNLSDRTLNSILKDLKKIYNRGLKTQTNFLDHK